MAKITLKDRVVQYMREKGKISQLEATYDVGTTRLSAIIFNLKKEGYKIGWRDVKAKNRYGDTTHFREYWIEE